MGKTNLHLGCGRIHLDDFVNIDNVERGTEDLIADLNSPLPFENNTVDLIFSDNVFEHIEGIVDLIRECHRVLKPGGHLAVRVPYFRAPSAYVDPTHCNFFTLLSFDYYVKGTNAYERTRFFDESFSESLVFIDNDRRGPTRKLIRLFATLSPWLYEKSLFGRIASIENVIFVLKK